MSKRSVAYTRVLGQALITIVLAAIAFLQVPLAHASPITISISPDHGSVGSIVTIAGLNATENGEVGLYLFGNLFLTSTKTNETGGYSINLAVPAIPYGTYSIVAVDLASGDTASEFLTVEPRILLTPTEGSFEDKVAVRGNGFIGNSDIGIMFDGTDVTPFPTPRTDGTGSFEASLYVPSTPNGTRDVVANDAWGNTASAPFNILPQITLRPTSGNTSDFVFLNGHGFSPAVNATAYFGTTNITLYPTCMTSAQGSFSMPFFVPNVPNGTYSVSVIDATGNAATTPFTVASPILTLTPDRTTGSSIITAKGAGFQPYSPVILYLEDIMTTNLVDLMWASENLMPQVNGSFEYSFVVPITNPGVYNVAAFQALSQSSSDLKKVASASLTVFEKIPLDAQVQVGSVHFRGEIAEFYLKTALMGKLVDVNIDKATLYFLNGSSEEDLLTGVSRISTGFYRIPYAIQNLAPLGTYALLAQASYQTLLTQASGTASGTFLLSPTLTAQNAQLLNIDNNIGTILVPGLDTIKANLTAIDAKLVDIDGKVATVQSDIGVLKTGIETINATLVSIDGKVATVQSNIGILRTDVRTINATLASIDGKVATIKSDLGNLKTSIDSIHARVTSIDGDMATVSSDLGTVKLQTGNSGSQNSIATIFAIVAAIGATLSALMIYRRRTPSSPTTAPPKESPPPTPEESPTKVSIQPEEVQAPTDPTPPTAIAIPQEQPIAVESQPTPPPPEETSQQQT